MRKTKQSQEFGWSPWGTDFGRMTEEQRTAYINAYQAKNNAFLEADLHGKTLAKWKYQRYIQDYMATVAAVDEGVGKVLDYLKKTGLAENTIVIYTADQGFFLGEKGYFDKRYMFEPSMGMPLLIMYPKHIKQGSIVTGLTQNIDFAETFLDYAGIEIPEDMQGKSFRPLLENKMDDEDFRDAIYYHYYDFPAWHMVKKMYGIHTKRYTLVHYYDDINTWELYDLKNDPKEMHNLIDDPGYDEVEARLRDQLKQLQVKYHVTDQEFKKASPEAIDRAYKTFERLRNRPDIQYGKDKWEELIDYIKN